MRGVAPLVVLATALCLAGAASAASSTKDTVRDALPLDARDILANPTAFDLLLLPRGLTGDWDVRSITRTELPGPNAALQPDITFLTHRIGALDLPRLPGVDPLAGLDTSASTPLARAATLGDAYTGTLTEASQTTQDDAPTKSAAPDGPTADKDPSEDLGTTSASSAKGASIASSLKQTWEDMGPAAKTAVGAGALGLLLFGPLAMYSRIARDDALKNKTRRKIYDLIEANPSLCIKDVADRAGVSYSTASYHLDRLVKTGFLVSSEQGNKVCYYKNGGTFDRDERQLVPILKNDECMRVFNHVLENPWCYRAEVAQALGVSHTTVNWHLKRLTDAGLVDEHREGRNCHLFIDQPALDRILTVLDKMEEVGVSESGAFEHAVPA